MSEKIQAGGTFSILGTGTVITGNIKTDGTIRIDGKIVGNIATKADAVIGLTGIVEGSVEAMNITVAGKVMGTLTAVQKLVLENKAVLKGDLRTARLVVDEGATFDGRSSMTGTPPGGALREPH